VLGVWRLQMLREVARRGSISAAAAAMSVSPSAVSQQLAVLEREAGIDLLEKAGRMVRLTNAGEALVRHAGLVTDALAAAEAEMAAMRHEVSGTLRVAAFPTAARALMPSVMVRLGRLHPALRVTLKDYEAPESLSALEMDEIDVAIVDEYDESTRVRVHGIETEEIVSDPLYFAFPSNHRLAHAEVSFSDLGDELWIMDAESSRLHQVTLAACRAAGIDPRVRSHCKDHSVIISLVEAGLGVAVLPGLALRDRSARLILRPTKPPMSRMVLAAVRRKRRSTPAIASMLEVLTGPVGVLPSGDGA
jgi:DNA-binding transcriptional LysR family regulator